MNTYDDIWTYVSLILYTFRILGFVAEVLMKRLKKLLRLDFEFDDEEIRRELASPLSDIRIRRRSSIRTFRENATKRSLSAPGKGRKT